MSRKTKQFLREILLPAAVICLAAGILFYAGSQAAAARFNRRQAAQIASYVETIHEKYPEIPEGELLRALKEAPAETDVSVLEKFGYTGEDFLANDAKAYARSMWGLGMLCLLLACAGCAGWLVHLQKKREKRVQELIAYLHEIEDRVYRLRAEENAEDEFSLLANELYKIAVILKEASENSRKDAENLSRALADISHQLKTPLAGIQILLDNILDNPDMDDALREEFLRTISSQTERIAELVEILLQLARFDAGTIQFTRELTPVRTVVEEALSDLEILLEVSQVEAELSGDLDLELLLDRRWEREAVKNIMKNCIEHSPKGSTLHVKAEDCGLFARLIIRDEGEGIDEEDLPHIFERFYKAKNSAAGSIGIGLSLAKAVVEKDEGTITVDSKPGEGTTFTLRWRVPQARRSEDA